MSAKKKFRVTKRYMTFFGGIAYCLFSVILILNVGYVARFFAFPFVYLFGLCSYAIYIFTYAYGLFLFFKERGYKIRLGYPLFGTFIIFLGALMIATLIITKDIGVELNKSTMISQYNAVLKGIENGYWKASFINLFQGNKFGGGFIGYILVGLCNTVFKKTAGSWAVAIIIILLGLFVAFFPQLKKIVLGTKNEKKPVAQTVSSNVSTRPIQIKETITPVDTDAVIASAGRLEPLTREERPTVPNMKAPEPTPAALKVPPIDPRNDMAVPIIDPAAYSGSGNFTPAIFTKFALKSQQSAQPQSSFNKMNAPEVMPEPVRNSAPINEQMTLDFDAKQPINDDLVKVRPEFVEPVSTSRTNIMPSVEPVIQEQPKVHKPIKWVPPSTALLETLETQGATELNNSVAEERMAAINEVFDDFHVGAQCVSYIVGPSVTRYNIEYGHNVSVRSVNNLVQDISVRLGGVNAVFESVVEGQRYSGLEIPNARITSVSFKEVYESLPDVKKHPLAVIFGKSIEGKCVGADFDEFPHLLVAGTTGSGKSIYNHSLVCTLISRNSPEDLRLVLIDPKQVEMSKYEDIPHLLCPIINDANVAKLTLCKLVDEMNRRYGMLKSTGCSNIKQYAELCEENPSMEKMPYILIFIDEYADLVDVCKDISQPIVSLAQKARACGIHMLIATQRPSTNIITGVIKGNLPTRVALAVASATDSITILGEGNAEKLLGKGDMFVQSPLVSRVGMVRLQGCFIQNKEILRIVGYLKEHYPVNYDPEFSNLEQAAAQAASEMIGSAEFKASIENSEEAKYQNVKDWVMAHEYMSMSKIQRECAVGFNRAGKFFKRLQDEGIVGTENDGNKGCPVLQQNKFYEGSVQTDIPVSLDQSE